jgi:hypothetical protein
VDPFKENAWTLWTMWTRSLGGWRLEVREVEVGGGRVWRRWEGMRGRRGVQFLSLFED